jgi:hypothetical protein
VLTGKLNVLNECDIGLFPSPYRSWRQAKVTSAEPGEVALIGKAAVGGNLRDRLITIDQFPACPVDTNALKKKGPAMYGNGTETRAQDVRG